MPFLMFVAMMVILCLMGTTKESRAQARKEWAPFRRRMNCFAVILIGSFVLVGLIG